ncbi:hypothetical protein JG688_00016128 [Phytophthora aleatoria]|uniref:Uncharacterized protein n=1 Tax=Phytophthora aleatoria TaxID=2496075 RepID=A0A8J5MD13_9STRA|nr:hypothetical protein JG688_00016128 [Phytophthora aleatoria]
MTPGSVWRLRSWLRERDQRRLRSRLRERVRCRLRLRPRGCRATLERWSRLRRLRPWCDCTRTR